MPGHHAAMLFAALCLAALQVPPSGSDIAKTFAAPEGVRVDLWAESPLFFNPTAIDVDGKGRVWVTEAVNYRRWGKRNPGLAHPEGDRVVVLEDKDGDGRAETATVFVQDKDLTAPLGIAVLGDRVFVSCSPNLFVYRDRDGDLVADEREVFLTGFGGFDHDHGLHSVVATPWGELFWCAGNAGPHLVRDHDGFMLRSGSAYTGGGPTTVNNQPGLVSDDGRVWVGGLVGAMRLDGGGLRVLAHNFRNEYEIAANSFGDMFTEDNDDDGNAGCRTVVITEGGNYGYFSGDGARTWQVDRRPDQDRLAAHWHQDDPGVMPLGCGNGGGGPTGVAVYEGSLLPQLAGAVLNCDAGRSAVYAHRPHVEGAGVKLAPGTLLGVRPTGDNSSRWFRPSDVAVAADGSILVADWYDPGVGGHAMGDREGYGRILRLVPQGHAAGWGRLDTSIDSPAVHVRARAALAAVPAELAAPKADDLPALARRLWVWARDKETQPRVRAALQHGDARIRLTAYRALRQAQGFDLTTAASLAADPSAFVRAEIAATLRDVPWAECADFLTTLARAHVAGDRQYLECVGLGATGKEAQLWARLLTEFGDRALRAASSGGGGVLFELAWRLHPESALPLLRGAAQAGGADPTVWRAALDAIAFIPGRAAAETMLALAAIGDDARRSHAEVWLAQNAIGRWRTHGITAGAVGDLADAKTLWTSPVIRRGDRAQVDVDVRGADVLWLVVDDAGNGNSCDWADWIAPRFVGATGETKLTSLAWQSATAEWGEVRKQHAADGRPLRVGGKRVADGIGTHAHSQIAFRVPAGAERFVAECAGDDGGTEQGGNATSIRFAVHVEVRPDLAAVQAEQRAALGGDVALATKLAASTDGALFLVTRAAELPAQVRAAVEPKLQAHADLAVRALASEAFPRRTRSGEALPPLDALAALAGDIGRGRELFRGRATCVACHVVDDIGGALGPDLSLIRDKFGRREVIDAVLNPSAAIAFGFDSWRLSLQDGRVLVGAVLADGDPVVLRDLAGRREVLAAAEVIARQRQTVSLMPDALALGLSAQDLADLATFLLDDPSAAPTFGPTQSLFDGKSLDGWREFVPGGHAAPTFAVRDGVLACRGEPAGYIHTVRTYTNFELTLEWRVDPSRPGNSGVLLRVQAPHKVWPRAIEAQLNTGDAGDIWNIDEFQMTTDPARTRGRHTVKLLPGTEKPLGEWNRYRLRLDHGRCTLEVNGAIQNTASWCEELAGTIALQSEGAAIEFRAIELREILD